MNKSCVILLPLAIVLATTLVAAQEQPPAGAKVAPFPQPKPGSWWLFQDTAFGETKVELKSVEEGKFVLQVEERGSTRGSIVTNEWNPTETLSTRGQWLTFLPHSRVFSFPLWEGKKWGGPVTVKTSGGFGQAFSVRGEAKRWETITVPAGTFEAIRVEALGNPAGGTICWYALEAERSIKCEIAIGAPGGRTFELLKYEVKR